MMGRSGHDGVTGDEAGRIGELERLVQKLTKINAALIERVERSMDQQATAFSLFQTAIALESQVRVRTAELKNALDRLERANSELVEARDSAERANRFKTRFFTAVGHDLLQPLHAARLTLSAMVEGGEGRHLTLQIDHALSSIEALLKTILDLSKLEAGAMQPSVRTIAVEELFHGIVRDLEPIAAARGVELGYRPTRAVVRSDPLMLRRIVQNLVANAVQYTVKGRVRLMGRRRNGEFRLEVWDTGPGIPPAERDRIFEEFQRGSASETARIGGFGLGLSIVHRMSEALGHRVSLCSRQGRGTCFSVLVPYAGTSAEVSAGEPRPVIATGLPHGRVLVIENEPSVVMAMIALLGRWGCEVEAVSGRADLDRLLSDWPDFVPDIVLADYHLDHGETGIELASWLRAKLGRDFPVVLISADQMIGTQVSAELKGIEVLRKPIRPAELRALMQHILGAPAT